MLLVATTGDVKLSVQRIPPEMGATLLMSVKPEEKEDAAEDGTGENANGDEASEHNAQPHESQPCGAQPPAQTTAAPQPTVSMEDIGDPTSVLAMSNMITPQELASEEEVKEIEIDTREESSKYVPCVLFLVAR